MSYSLRATVFLLLISLILCDVYSTKMASKMTYFAAISYQPQQSLQAWSCQFCSKVPLKNVKVVSNSSNSVFGYVGFSQEYNSIVIAFRGSVDTANWILNLKTTRTSYPLCTDCSVHVGFNQGFNSVKVQVDAHINDLLALYRTSKMILAGHSLGGALAVMAAAYLQNVYGQVTHLYTMGQPRVGNDAFAKFMTTFIPNSFRIVDYADQVPHVPQSILGFKHSGYEIWYQRGMENYTVCPSQSKDCSNQLTILTLTQADHKMVLYLELKVQDSFTALRQAMKFKFNQLLNRGRVFALDEVTKQIQDKKVKQQIEKLRQQNIIKDI